MELISDKFIGSNEYISECLLLTHSNKIKNIILLYTRDHQVLLFKREKKSKSYSTEVYYNDVCYKIILKKQKTSLTYNSYIYFDIGVSKEIQEQIVKRLYSFIKNIFYMNGYESGSNFNKMISSLINRYYTCNNIDINTMCDDDNSYYNYIKTKLNYKCDLSNREINCDIQNMLLLSENYKLDYYEDSNVCLECNTNFYSIENIHLIPNYCFKYIPELNNYIVETNDDYEDTIIEYNGEKYIIYDGVYIEDYFNDNTTLFKYKDDYILCYKYDIQESEENQSTNESE